MKLLTHVTNTQVAHVLHSATTSISEARQVRLTRLYVQLDIAYVGGTLMGAPLP